MTDTTQEELSSFAIRENGKIVENKEYDFEISYPVHPNDSIAEVRILSEAAKTFVDERVNVEVWISQNSFACDIRYAFSLSDAIVQNGFTLNEVRE